MIGILLLALAATQPPQQAQQSPVPRSIAAVRVTVPPAIDGRLDSIWSTAPAAAGSRAGVPPDIAPSCFIRPIWSIWCQCSVTLPALTRKMWISLIE